MWTHQDRKGKEGARARFLPFALQEDDANTGDGAFSPMPSEKFKAPYIYIYIISYRSKYICYFLKMFDRTLTILNDDWVS